MRIEVALIKVSWQPCSLHLLLQIHSRAARSSWGHETNLHLGVGEKGRKQTEACVRVRARK